MIGGNLEVEIQVKTVTENEIGEHEEQWVKVDSLKGFLDLVSGEAKYTNYDAKIQESTHYFIADYKTLDPRVKAETSRIFEPEKREYYDIKLIDNPMGMNDHYEIYLKYTGGQ